jgi:hypothetical protein
MTRISIVASALLASTLTLVGCDKGSDEQQKANAAQAEADRKIAEANKKASTETTSAQVEADKKIAAAEGDFGKRREDYRHKVQENLIELDKKIALLEAKTKKVSGNARTDLDAKLAAVRVSRSAFASDLASIDSAAALQWDGVKAKADKDWSDLKALVDKID